MEICIRGLKKAFGHNGSQVPVLEDINLELGAGEFVSLVGPSGCGKSTLLHIITGLDQADAGTITVDGRLVKGPGAERVAIFQDPSLFPWLTVRENVEFGLKVRGVAPAERRRRAFEYLRMVHLASFSDHYPKQLSGGMRQRTAIARALALDPEILLMDEPFAALDAITREEMSRSLLEIWERTQKTIVLVTHSIDEAVLLSTEAHVMGLRPARIVETLRVELPQPRGAESFRDPRFGALEAQLRHLLLESHAHRRIAR